MKFINKSIFSLVAIGATLLMGCEKDFLDINEDPNNPTEAPLNQILPNAQETLAGNLGDAGLGGLTSLFMAQTVTRELNDYGITGQTFGVTSNWNGMFLSTLTDLGEVINIGTEREAWNYVGVAQILKAYSFSTMVDVWGSLPFDDANQGAVVRFPNYESGSDIYDKCFSLIDEGMANLDKSSTLPMGLDDLYYQGDLGKWKVFANTLKLNMYNKIRLVRDVSSEVNALIASGNIMSSRADDFEMQYGTSPSPDNRNPSYSGEYAPGGGTYINPYFFEMLRGMDTFGHGNALLAGIVDPRIPYYFYNQLAAGESDSDAENPCAYCPTRSGTPFLSIFQFSFNIDPNEGFDQASSQTVQGLYPLGGKYDDGSGATANFNGQADVAQRLLTYDMSLYVRAELAQAGVSNENAASLFDQAMNESFGKVNDIAASASVPLISSAAISSYTGAVNAIFPGNELETIITQKWIASYGNSLESYNDYRRTGFPIMYDGNTDNLTTTVRGRDYPVSFPYNTNSIELNNNAPSQRRPALDKVFWDK